MPDARHTRGVIAENAARAYLRGLGWEILDTNYRTRYGEVDIIAQCEEMVCFVEVRARSRRDIVSPAESVNHTKQRKLVLTASAWLAQTDCDAPCRFDVIEIQIVGGLARIAAHIQGAFEPADSE
ncbi:MAG: YraN family protein [Armatimonadota bacterium]